MRKTQYKYYFYNTTFIPRYNNDDNNYCIVIKYIIWQVRGSFEILINDNK